MIQLYIQKVLLAIVLSSVLFCIVYGNSKQKNVWVAINAWLMVHWGVECISLFSIVYVFIFFNDKIYIICCHYQDLYRNRELKDGYP